MTPRTSYIFDLTKARYVSDFDSRLKTVEDMLKRHHDLLIGHLSACAGEPKSILLENGNGSKGQIEASRGSIQLHASDLQDLPAEETVTDGMAISFVDDVDSAFFGPSSNIAFTRHILGAMVSSNITQPRTLTINGNRSQLESGIVDYTRQSLPSSPSAKILSPQAVFELPPLEEMEHLLSLYFQNAGLLFPFIHPPSFMATYNNFKASNFSKVRRVWLGLLNIVLAMSLGFNPGGNMSAAERVEKSQNFYERAVKLCGNASVRGASLELVSNAATQACQARHLR